MRRSSKDTWADVRDVDMDAVLCLMHEKDDYKDNSHEMKTDVTAKLNRTDNNSDTAV